MAETHRKIKAFLEHSRKLRFILIGGLNTLLGLSTFPLIYVLTRSIDLSYLWVLVISQSVCVNFSFLTNKYYVFKSKGKKLAEYRRFVIFHMSTFLINLGGLPIFVEFFHLNPMVVQLIFTLMVVVGSYIWYSKFTFK